MAGTLDPTQLKPQHSQFGWQLQGLQKGINNRHLDVLLSDKYRLSCDRLIDELLNHYLNRWQLSFPASPLIERFRRCYSDVQTCLIQRHRQDLSKAAIQLLQLAPIKYLICTTTERVLERIDSLKQLAHFEQKKNVALALKTSEKMQWLAQQRNAMHFRICQRLFREIQRAEDTELVDLRKLRLGNDFLSGSQILLNPILQAFTPLDPQLLSQHYSLIPPGNNQSQHWQQLQKSLLSLATNCFNSDDETIYNSGDNNKTIVSYGSNLAGLASIEKLLPANTTLSCQIDSLDALSELSMFFDKDSLRRAVQEVRQRHGIKASMAENKHRRYWLGQLKTLRKLLSTNNLKEKICVAYAVAKYIKQERSTYDAVKLTQLFENKRWDKHQAATFFPGQHLSKEAELSFDEINTYRQNFEELILPKLITDLSRYNHDLKTARLALQGMSELRILNDAEEIELSSGNQQCYCLLTSSEGQRNSDTLTGHSVLKADVRGSMAITDELVDKHLNPASHFSLHFFKPINQLLQNYGASKVFIEGDAIILNIQEYLQRPEQNYSVSRSCGLARDILSIVKQQNLICRKHQLPALELGIGITYHPQAPRFLYDEGRAIMISPAIGEADRLSACAWTLRQTIEGKLPKYLAVDVVQPINQSNKNKNIQLWNYNVNGILLSTAAFNKINNEINLKLVNFASNLLPKNNILLMGHYRDVNNVRRPLLLRKASINSWHNIQGYGKPTGDYFYEVISDERLNSMASKQSQPSESELA